MHPTQPHTISSGMHDAMWRGHGGWEMSLMPVVFGGIGWFVDGWLGTRPVFTIVLAIAGLVGSVANQYYQYRYRMEVATELRRAAQDGRSDR